MQIEVRPTSCATSGWFRWFQVSRVPVWPFRRFQCGFWPVWWLRPSLGWNLTSVSLFAVTLFLPLRSVIPHGIISVDFVVAFWHMQFVFVFAPVELCLSKLVPPRDYCMCAASMHVSARPNMTSIWLLAAIEHVFYLRQAWTSMLASFPKIINNVSWVVLRESWEAICIGSGYCLRTSSISEILNLHAEQSVQLWASFQNIEPNKSNEWKQWYTLSILPVHSCCFKLPGQEKYEQPCSFLFFRILHDLYMPVPLKASRTTMQESLKNGIYDVEITTRPYLRDDKCKRLQFLSMATSLPSLSVSLCNFTILISAVTVVSCCHYVFFFVFFGRWKLW